MTHCTPQRNIKPEPTAGYNDAARANGRTVASSFQDRLYWLRGYRAYLRPPPCQHQSTTYSDNCLYFTIFAQTRPFCSSWSITHSCATLNLPLSTRMLVFGPTDGKCEQRANKPLSPNVPYSAHIILQMFARQHHWRFKLSARLTRYV